ncbi:hypothetical protein, partial [Enterococcus sp. 3H8_DIV0648]|uniref:hypothetical protein n=1 Tax=Enterococcus sp. 3H8_DIV0648 TaxID=1834178 RepID=UPI001C387076
MCIRDFLITGSRLCAQIIQTESTAEIKGSLEELDRYILSNNYEHADRYFREIYLNSSHEKKGRSGTRILRCNISKAADQKYKAKS